MDIYKTLDPVVAEQIFKLHIEHAPRYCILSHKTSLNNFKRIEIIEKCVL